MSVHYNNSLAVITEVYREKKFVIWKNKKNSKN